MQNNSNQNNSNQNSSANNEDIVEGQLCSFNDAMYVCGKISKFKHENEEYKIKIYAKKDNLDKEDGIIDDNAVLKDVVNIKDYTHYKIDAKSIGMVVYADSDQYDQDIGNDDHRKYHIRDAYSATAIGLWPFIIVELVNCYFGNGSLRDGVIGHEHGKLTHKCHLQICVNFTTRKCCKGRPGLIEIEVGGRTEVYLFMLQNCRKNKFALKNYCTKEGDIQFINQQNGIEFVHKIDAKGDDKGIDVFSTIQKNYDKLDREEAESLIREHDARSYFMSFKNIQGALDKIYGTTIPDEEFHWRFDEESLNKANMREETKNILKTWFKKECCKKFKPNDVNPRKKALLIYSKLRRTGKTVWAQSLCDKEYQVIMRGNLCDWTCKDCKLLILDDINYSDFLDKRKRECYKQLVTGSECNVEAKYLNKPWPFHASCIITTNNLSVLRLMGLHEEFSSEVDIVVLNEKGANGQKETMCDPALVYDEPPLKDFGELKDTIYNVPLTGHKKDKDNNTNVNLENEDSFWTWMGKEANKTGAMINGVYFPPKGPAQVQIQDKDLKEDVRDVIYKIYHGKDINLAKKDYESMIYDNTQGDRNYISCLAEYIYNFDHGYV